MTVTELTLLQLAPGVEISNATLRANLLKAVQVMQQASSELAADVAANFPTANVTHIANLPSPTAADPTSPKFHLYQQSEDPSLLYLIGTWPSRALHLNTFIPSPANQALVASLKEPAQIDFARSTVNHVALTDHPTNIPFDAPLLVIRRHAIRPADNAAFEAAFDDVKHHVAHVSARPIAAGWQVERASSDGKVNDDDDDDDDDDGSEIFVLFSGWDDRDHHAGFADSDRGREYDEIRRWIDEGGLEVRHAVRVDL